MERAASVLRHTLVRSLHCRHISALTTVGAAAFPPHDPHALRRAIGAGALPPRGGWRHVVGYNVLRPAPLVWAPTLDTLLCYEDDAVPEAVATWLRLSCPHLRSIDVGTPNVHLYVAASVLAAQGVVSDGEEEWKEVLRLRREKAPRHHPEID